MAKRRQRYRSDIAVDLQAENNIIGLAMMLDFKQAHAMLGKLNGQVFFSEINGWMWEELRLAVLTKRLGLQHAGTFKKWMRDRKIIETIKRRWSKQTLYGAFEMRGVSNSHSWFQGFWWHWPWYVERVKAAYVLRCEQLRYSEALRQAATKNEAFNRFSIAR